MAGLDQQQVAPGGVRLPDSATRSNPRSAVFRHHWILWAGPVVVLVAALLPWPYGYYNFLRFCICGAASFLAYQQWTHDDAGKQVGCHPGGDRVAVQPVGSDSLDPGDLDRPELSARRWSLLGISVRCGRLLHETARARVRSRLNARDGRWSVGVDSCKLHQLARRAGDHYMRQGPMTKAEEVARAVREEAERGDVDAQAAMGVMYLIGRGVEQDLEEAVAWLRRAAEQDNLTPSTTWASRMTQASTGCCRQTPSRRWHGTASLRIKATLDPSTTSASPTPRATVFRSMMCRRSSGGGRPQKGVTREPNTTRGQIQQGRRGCPRRCAGRGVVGQGRAIARHCYETSTRLAFAGGKCCKKGFGDPGRGEHGNADAQYHLGRVYALGRGAPRRQ